MCTSFPFQNTEHIELGVLEIENDAVHNYIEELSSPYQVSIDIYVLSNDILDFVPRETI